MYYPQYEKSFMRPLLGELSCVASAAQLLKRRISVIDVSGGKQDRLSLVRRHGFANQRRAVKATKPKISAGIQEPAFGTTLHGTTNLRCNLLTKRENLIAAGAAFFKKNFAGA